MQAMATRATIRPYSIAVAPRFDLANWAKIWRMVVPKLAGDLHAPLTILQNRVSKRLKRVIEMEINPTLFPVVAALLIDSEGRVLVQQRPPGRAMEGLWEFPGGKIEPGETPEQALARELTEELGIIVADSDLVPFTFASDALGDRHLILLLYRCLHWQGKPAALHATALRWATVAQLQQLPMPPADLPLLAIIARSLAHQGSGQYQGAGQ